MAVDIQQIVKIMQEIGISVTNFLADKINTLLRIQFPALPTSVGFFISLLLIALVLFWKKHSVSAIIDLGIISLLFISGIGLFVTIFPFLLGLVK